MMELSDNGSVVLKRTVELHVGVPPITINDPTDHSWVLWDPGPETALHFAFDEWEIQGVVSLGLDPEAMVSGVTWDTDEGGQASARAFPKACRGLVLVIQGDSDQTVSDREFLEVVQDLTDRYVNRLLSFARIELGQHWVTPVSIADWQLGDFLDAVDGCWLEQEPQLVGDPLGSGFVAFEPAIGPVSFDDQEAPLDLRTQEALRQFIEGGGDPSPELELLARAKQYCVTDDLRMAVVEAATALEIGLERFLRKRCQVRGIAPRVLDEVKLNVSTCLKLIIPMALDREQLVQYHELADACDQLRKVRNRVVHEAGDPGAYPEIREGIASVDRLLEFIAGLQD